MIVSDKVVDPKSNTGNARLVFYDQQGRTNPLQQVQRTYDKQCQSIKSKLHQGLLMDLETDGEVIGFTPLEIYEHTKTNFLLPRDVSREITKTRQDLREACDPDEIVQIYYKKLHTVTITLAALEDSVMDVEIMRYAFETFKLQSDLKEACRD